MNTNCKCGHEFNSDDNKIQKIVNEQTNNGGIFVEAYICPTCGKEGAFHATGDLVFCSKMPQVKFEQA
jgi:hypothetical protein